ncbi:MAG: hypothetical protein DSM106950_11085 [Stigonema ocellatum SAG 48.90 = DSM 106950]|nr:hypothetical protein [Stigonema ocellatum SAG 48.90 = DSM 106950]
MGFEKVRISERNQYLLFLTGHCYSILSILPEKETDSHAAWAIPFSGERVSLDQSGTNVIGKKELDSEDAVQDDVVKDESEKLDDDNNIYESINTSSIEIAPKRGVHDSQILHIG